MLEVKKKFNSNNDYNKSTVVCPISFEECKKINKRINNKKLTQIREKEISHLFIVLNY